LGKALAEGEGYKAINSPGNVSFHTKYPPGLPVLLSLFYPLNFIGYKIIIFLLSIATLFFLSRWFKDYPNPLVFIFLLLMALNLKLVEYSSLILSEVPFLFFVTLGFYFFTYHKNLTMGLICFGIAYYMRSIGIVLFPALLLHLLFRKEYRLAAIAFVSTLVILAPWQVWAQIHGGASYLKVILMKNPYLSDTRTIDFSYFFTQRIPLNIKSYSLIFIPETILPVFKANGFALLGGILTAITLSGFGLDFYKKWDLKGWYFVGNLAVVLAWPEVWRSERFLFGIIPLIVFYFVYFFYRITNNSIFTVIAAMFLTVTALTHADYKNPQTNYTSDWVNYKKCALWLKDNAEENAVIVCRKPSLVYLWSGKKTISIPKTRKIVKRFKTAKVTHILFDNFYWSNTTARYLYPLIKKNQGKFEIIHALDEPPTYVLKLKK
jgi:hypothetical protein